MTDLEDILARLWAQLPGCRVVAVVGMGGLRVDRHPVDCHAAELRSGPDADELEHVAADLTPVLSLAGGELSHRLGGRVDEVIALGEAGGYLARRIDSELFVFVVVGASADLGAVRRETAEVCRQLAGAFA